ncbi:type 2 DNA topoisomerase 6 subunit B-like isoform X3 [Larimichthys crocea]|uniref:type 2 DNA topoisomerase 6 subunit B-like isoform X3 n=1 Tax=Larimichthys crocea TaxID=215358 RepID=UPI000F5DF25B|nr:uncharacterized protein LOC104920001 isoform X3 [Larimichthys crocea]
MSREIQQVLRLVMLLGKQRGVRVQAAGGLLVLLWTKTGAAVQSLNCTVAGAGPWCKGIKMKTLEPVLTDLKESMFPRMSPCPSVPDPEELCAFTDLYGSLRLLLSFQMRDSRLFIPEWCVRIEEFLRMFSLVNAGIKTQLKLQFSQQTFQQEFRVKIKSKVARAKQPSLMLDVTCRTQPPECVKKGCWCQGGHPLCGSRLPLSIPPEAMERDHVNSGATVYTAKQENLQDSEQELSLPSVQQTLLLFLFLQHSDPFTCHLSDSMATEALIEHHLEGILSNNRQAVTTALQTELKNALKGLNRGKKNHEKLRSAAEVILSSSISIVSCSSNLDFRNACLSSMKVRDTHELSASLRESLRRVTSWKFIPRGKCYPTQVEEQEGDEPTGREI